MRNFYYIRWTHIASGQTGYRPRSEADTTALEFDNFDDALATANSLSAQSQFYSYKAVPLMERPRSGPAR